MPLVAAPKALSTLVTHSVVVVGRRDADSREPPEQFILRFIH